MPPVPPPAELPPAGTSPLRLLADLSAAVHRAGDVRAIIAVATAGVRAYLGADRVMIALREGRRRPVVVDEEADAPVAAQLRARGSPAWQRLEATRRPVVVPDVTRDPEYLAYLGKLFPNGGAPRAMLLAPIEVGGELEGALTCHQVGRPREWTEDEVQLVAAVAQQVAVAIERARLLAAERRARADAEATSEVLRRRAAELEAVLAGMVEGVAVLDTAGRPFLLNEAARRLVGPIAASPDLAQRLSFYGARDRTGAPLTVAATPIARALRGETVVDFEFQIQPPGAPAPRWITTTAAPISDDTGRQIGAVTVFRDVTEERRLARAKDEFFSIASHELKTPMTTVKGIAQLMERALARGEPLDPERARQNLALLVHQIDRMAGLVDDMLDLTRIQAGRLRLRPAPTDLVALAREVAARFRRAMEDPADREIRIDAAVPQLVATVDPARIDQVLTNLLSNALKYSPRGTDVVLGLEQIGGEARLRVCDAGRGLDTETLRHLFEPFFRVDEAHGSDGGLGLGLYITRSLVAQHGGRIWAESEGPGRGSCFYVVLPIGGPDGPRG